MVMNVSKTKKSAKASRARVVELQSASLVQTIEVVARVKQSGTPIKLIGQRRQFKLRSPG